MRYISRFVFSLVVVTLSVGCAGVRVQPQNTDFDQLLGKGPMVIVTTDESAAPNAFFKKHWVSSVTIKHLVTQRGTPEAIGVEREFLKPHRLKLYYPSQGQVYLLDQVEGDWLVAGSEPILRSELELFAQQRNNLMHQAQAAAKAGTGSPVVNGASVVSEATTAVTNVTKQPEARVDPPPVASLSPAEYRGMLKAPSKARLATLTEGAHDTYLHTVTFPTEDIAILADWYTENPGNAEQIARSNKRSVGAMLVLGQRIAIPKSMMRNPHPLPESMVP